MKKIYLLSILLLLVGCNRSGGGYDNSKNPINPKKIESIYYKEKEATIPEEKLVNLGGMTIETRYNTPKGYERTEEVENFFPDFLRNQKLKPYGEKVLYYNGREKNKSNVYDSVFDVEIGDRDLHQCADAIMLLRGEYLYSQGLYEDINFNFVSGFKAEYSKWMEGYRIKVDGNKVWYHKATDPLNDYETFRKYMDMVFAYSGSLSLDKELESVNIEDMKIGHVFIIGGSPGHGVIIVDMCENQGGEKMFILAQSYMPAQETQILINPNNKVLSPWYSLEEVKDQDKLITPEWTFELDRIKAFKD